MQTCAIVWFSKSLHDFVALFVQHLRIKIFAFHIEAIVLKGLPSWQVETEMRHGSHSTQPGSYQAPAITDNKLPLQDMHCISSYRIWGVLFKIWYTIILLIVWPWISRRNVSKWHRKGTVYLTNYCDHIRLMMYVGMSTYIYIYNIYIYIYICIYIYIYIKVEKPRWCNSCIMKRHTVRL